MNTTKVFQPTKEEKVIGKKLLSFLDYKLENGSFRSKELFQLIEQITKENKSPNGYWADYSFKISLRQTVSLLSHGNRIFRITLSIGNSRNNLMENTEGSDFSFGEDDFEFYYR